MGSELKKFALLLSLLVLSACSDANNTSASKANGAEKSGQAAQALANAQSRVIEVWKTPTCGCCQAWIDHLKAEGFEVKANDVRETASFRAALGISQDYGSCHSARVGGYALEGHVPAAEIRKLLQEKPDAIGLAVPNMPMGSPGMEHPDHPEKREAYDVLLIEKSGTARTYAKYEAR